MCFVVMTQPAWPGLWPLDLPVVGHAILVNKDFIEMLALLTIAAAGAGRWGGLDFFLCRFYRLCRGRSCACAEGKETKKCCATVS